VIDWRGARRTTGLRRLVWSRKPASQIGWGSGSHLTAEQESLPRLAGGTAAHVNTTCAAIARPVTRILRVHRWIPPPPRPPSAPSCSSAAGGAATNAHASSTACTALHVPAQCSIQKTRPRVTAAHAARIQRPPPPPSRPSRVEFLNAQRAAETSAISATHKVRHTPCALSACPKGFQSRDTVCLLTQVIWNALECAVITSTLSTTPSLTHELAGGGRNSRCSTTPPPPPPPARTDGRSVVDVRGAAAAHLRCGGPGGVHRLSGTCAPTSSCRPQRGWTHITPPPPSPHPRGPDAR
jgi:hypothetical protein